jgi:signal transduction histidine kinase
MRALCQSTDDADVRSPYNVERRPKEAAVQEHILQEEIGQGRQAEPALHDGELQFRRLLEKLPAAAYTCDPEGLITYFNQQAVHLWGRAPKLNEPVDRFCGSFKLLSPDGAPIPHDQCWMALALKMDKEYNKRESVIERPDGQRLTVLAHANPIHDESGKLLGAVNVLVDISDRKRAEEALLEIREAERRRIARDLHDVVLQDVMGALQGMQAAQIESEKLGSSAGLEQEIAALRRVVESLRNAIYDLRLEKEQPLVRAVESLVELNRQLTPGRDIRLTVHDGFALELPDDAEVGLLRVLQEALVNTRRHSEAWRVAVTLTTERRVVRAEVADDGRGFDPASVREGLGISGMRERALALGGKLEIESEPGQGTSVRVKIPL